MDSTVSIEGSVAPGFEAVAEAFGRNFSEHGEVGASLGIYLDGESVVDLWGGVADVGSGEPWTRDTLAVTYSVTKGATATLAHLLAARGEIDLDAPVADAWPEFGANRKGRITARDVLSHRAGLPVIDAELTREQLIDGVPVVESLVAQAPVWEPGTAHGYHALTYGWLMGEIVRRSTGRRLGELFAELVAGPLGIDFLIGAPPTDHARIARLIDPDPPEPAEIEAIPDPAARAQVIELIAALSDPDTLISRALNSNGALPTPDAAAWNDPRIFATEQPATNGVSNGSSLARMYAACVSEVDGVRLLDEETVAAATVEQSSGHDEVLLEDTRFGSGYMLLSPGCPMLSEASFGHVGISGALGFADHDAKLGFGYVQNQIGLGLTGEPRTETVIKALRAALET